MWWIYIFIECPYLSNAIKYEMKNILQKVQQTLNIKTASCISKKEVIKFLQNATYQYKFINWGIKKEEFYENIVFSTFDRTIFNTKGENSSDFEFEK